MSSSPNVIKIDESIAQVACGYYHSAALANTGKVRFNITVIFALK